MREIKFRVWDKLLKEFNVLSLHDITEDDYWYDGKSEMWSVFYDGTHEQEKFIIEQYTGLKDIHGVEICEGDRIKYHDDLSSGKDYNLGIIKFGEYYQDGSGGEYGGSKCLGFYVEMTKRYVYDGWKNKLEEWEIEEYLKQNSLLCIKDIEVIGNIHES